LIAAEPIADPRLSGDVPMSPYAASYDGPKRV
jgi:hypothetical protein